MEYLSGLILLVLTLLIVLRIARDAKAGTVASLSTRNIFLVGFIYFQTASGAITLFTGLNERGLYLNNPGWAGFLFTMYSILFITIFLWSYSLFRRKIPAPNIQGSTPNLAPFTAIFAAVIGVALGVVMRFVLGQVPILGVITIQLSVGFLTVACCLAAYAWSRNFWNVGSFVIFVGVTAASVAALLVNAFGRREILGVFMSMAWTLFYLKWRAMPKWQLITRGIFWTFITLGAVTVLSASRSSGQKERSVSEYVQAIGSLSGEEVIEQVVGAVVGQFAGGTSMWVIDTRPSEFSYDTLHTLVYISTFPMPRQYWEGKPNSLGRTITEQCRLSGVGSDHSFGPGLIGHIANDNPIFALPIYAVLLALFTALIDNRLSRYDRDPYEVAFLGVGISQILAIPRGELGLFLINAIGTMAGAWLLVKPFESVRARRAPDSESVAEAESGHEATSI
jgi:hypothetical protein